MPQRIYSFRASSVLVVGVLLALNSCAPELLEPRDFSARVTDPKSPPKVKCSSREPLRRALFGDLHVHTALSTDAWNYDVEVRPHDAYGYAFGESIWLPPKDAEGNGTREVRIDRPLDFAATTDHSEFLGEQRLCSDPNSPVYDVESCVGIRKSKTPLDNPLVFIGMNPWPKHKDDICGEDAKRCLEAARSAWDETITAAAAWNDESEACERTTFIAYEYSSIRLSSNLHRNVIFRNDIVPKRPASYLDFQREWDLWKNLRDDCLDSDTGCDVLAIPHNSNISNGRMFAVDYPGATRIEEQIERAKLRARVEPLVEIMQHKGDSECRPEMNGVLGQTDEFCSFEKMEAVRFQDDEGNPGAAGECWDFMADSLPHLGPGACMNHRNYVRYVLTEGLREEERLGVNPFKLGISASTDTHNGMAGGVAERGWPGHVGIVDGDVNQRLSNEQGMGNVSNNPGGLIGVWAEENSRDSIFDAMRRREVFGVSGPRIQPRFFGGWNYPEDLCDAPDWLEQADRDGVAMGGDLPKPSHGGTPSFAVFALADAGTSEAPGTDLQRIQVIKGWVDEDGNLRQQVFDVAGGDNGASVNPETCEPSGKGARQLCSVWRDPDFDPSRRAVYYARVLENPTCRYSTWKCLELPSSDRPPSCDQPIMERVIQERAWTSPIWYTPPALTEARNH
ncbi:DUF3604 domain-containing protein [Myxococcota bacterium]|nr:DUF3604 domain-containing protein [Myxococcota bacterium]